MPEFQVDSHEMQELWDQNPASTIQLSDAREQEENIGDLSVRKYRTNNDGGAKQLMSPLPRELSTFHSGSKRKRSQAKEKMSESKSRLSHGRKLFMTRVERDAIGSIDRKQEEPGAASGSSMIDYRMYHLELMNEGEPANWQDAKCEDVRDESLLEDVTVRDLNQGFRESKPKPKLSVNASPETMTSGRRNQQARISLST